MRVYEVTLTDGSTSTMIVETRERVSTVKRLKKAIAKTGKRAFFIKEIPLRRGTTIFGIKKGD